ncbi:hypothetical protein AB1Y20_006529 [Prymnesium parvum]|uniref:Uncharacterized protein n=1 Tax=Prymnesium parvum TaxID=97485 RepID=A0AB34IYQ5_PRYPA
MQERLARPARLARPFAPSLNSEPREPPTLTPRLVDMARPRIDPNELAAIREKAAAARSEAAERKLHAARPPPDPRLDSAPQAAAARDEPTTPPPHKLSAQESPSCAAAPSAAFLSPRPPDEARKQSAASPRSSHTAARLSLSTGAGPTPSPPTTPSSAPPHAPIHRPASATSGGKETPSTPRKSSQSPTSAAAAPSASPETPLNVAATPSPGRAHLLAANANGPSPAKGTASLQCRGDFAAAVHRPMSARVCDIAQGEAGCGHSAKAATPNPPQGQSPSRPGSSIRRPRPASSARRLSPSSASKEWAPAASNAEAQKAEVSSSVTEVDGVVRPPPIAIAPTETVWELVHARAPPKLPGAGRTGSSELKLPELTGRERR